MDPREAARSFRQKADIYLKMTAYARDERERRILHELFEKNEAQAELLEGDVFLLRGLQNNFCIRPRLN
jgi:hypothetical protein